MQKQVLLKRGHALHGDCDDERVHPLCCLRDGDGSSARLLTDLEKCLWTARVCDKNRVTEFAEVSGKCRSDVARSYDPDSHRFCCLLAPRDTTTLVFLDAETIVVDSEKFFYPQTVAKELPAKTEKKHTSKAAMIAEKDRAIVLAAREHFLRDGFAGASMDGIAKSAGVSVKTIYSHFANKNELFSKVMIAACTDHLLSEELPSEEVLAERFVWFRETTRRGLMKAGQEYLRHLLSDEQMALYRVVTRDADRFPELGQQYQKNVAQGRTGILIAYRR
jgi:AcrR family transcriptional regulator